MTLILLAPASTRITSNSVFSSSAAAAAPPAAPPAAATATGAAAETPHFGKLSSFQNGQRGEVFYDLSEISHFTSPLEFGSNWFDY
jgi:hypothetical protein